ncbi:RAMP superfamily CRISPR-associated protein [Streptosporangium saharense]|uniref:CRISPR/Cas system CSM-associated protein Csm3 (Group 7 of RAMP superfamily) n=1 Tax=Streptosporangium saharense TaxID=1706840 RepID=A0A7W7QI32_9ACTN|nr:RAMP superfamily CRISPR-associated protein [Streptosporangium saharense]MBB4913986.1 CRISPR/Cas system CSM-associated protein Csm3 (group 7 of RAMP superfamily) [Streptosporangium saharense]
MSPRAGRHLTSRVRARGWLLTTAPLHVGGLGHDPSDPLPIALDGQGRPYVPGTTLAGVLRHWMDGAQPGTLDGLWGSAEEKGHASRVVVADGLVTTEPRLDEHALPAAPLDVAALEFRPSVGIDRVTGAAAPEFLYGRAVIPAGHYVRLEIDVESNEEADLDEARMDALLTALRAGKVRVGAATGRGLGAVRLLDDPFEMVVDRFDSPEGLPAVLRDDPARRRGAEPSRRTDPALPPARQVLDIRVEWRPLAPVMVRAGAGGLFADTLPLTTRVDRRHVTLVLPGGSIKGALRGHAEFVERTAREGGPPAPSAPPGASPADYSAAFRAQLDQLPAVRALFGAARDGRERGAGALRAEECAALVTVPDELWDAAIGGEPDESDSVRDRLEDLGMARSDHVSLDRWTGGAADGRLFTVLEPHAVGWEPIRLSVDLTRLGSGSDVALALLLVTLRDLAEGRIPLGASANRGFGDIEVTEVVLTGPPWARPVTLPQALNSPEVSSVGRAWTDYLAQEVS